MTRRLFLLVLAVYGCSAWQADPLAPLRILEGSWEGPAKGEPGKGISTRDTGSSSAVSTFLLETKPFTSRNRRALPPKFTRISAYSATTGR